MKASVGHWMLVVCCSFAAAAAVEDNVLRFLSHKDVVRMGQEESQHQNPKEQTPVSVSVVCPGEKSECPEGSTCCQTSSGSWACCPTPKAVCCSDHLHCCPNGYKCDVATGSCTHSQSQATLPWSTKTPATPTVGDVICKDGKSECPDGTTCCKLSTGQYGCCPYPQAVCCKDGVHCCPNGYSCDVAQQSCTKGDLLIPFGQKLPARQRVESVTCPDHQSDCPDGDTCCELPNQSYGCCPLPDAVCCSDGEHCCPNGYKCNLAKQTCDQNEISIPLVKKRPKTSSVQNVVCPDKQSECPDGNTCCKLSSGEYGCCPIFNAVCCSDGVHCCPSRTTCDVAKGTCDSALQSIPWVKKVPAVHSVQSVVCPDGQSQCPDGSTCCKLSSGSYGCCPMPKAVCCSDGVHCCPSGTTCDVAKGTCDSALQSIPWVKKVPTVHSVQSVVCPDGKSQCPDGSTCCKLKSGVYGCCPMPNAECCSDGVHCCPSGTTCDVAKGTCDSALQSIPWVKKVPAVHSVQNVVCPDKSQCPDGSTCCQLGANQYGCCPLPKAVCCADHVHCCPSGYTCDTGSGSCKKGQYSMALIKKVPAIQSLP